MRPDILNPLFAEVEALKGVGAALSKPLHRLGIRRVIDTLFHLPTGWIDRRHLADLDGAEPGRQVVLSVTPAEYRGGGSPRAPMRVRATDDAGNNLLLVFFGKGGWARKLLPLGERRAVAGKVEAYDQYLQIVHPDVMTPEEAAALPAREPVYPLAEGLAGKKMQALAMQALARAPELPEWIEPSLLAKRGWPSWREAMARIHADPADGMARARAGYDELFANQLALTLVRASTRARRGVPLEGDGRLRGALKLPYAPTGAQARATAEILADMAQVRPMIRLLQGDVGAGKTLVATFAMLAAVEGGAQAALLAPTEILARQHYATLSRTLTGIGVNVAILTSREKGRARESTLMGLADGSIDILIGTHSIFQETVSYKRLGLVVVDEQHRFGVAQRMMLQAKAERPPHVLVMTATPIPRTLTLTQYGEMDVSRLDELPPGRQPIETLVMGDEKMAQVVDGLGRHIEGGGQAYWVCPLVEETESGDMAAAESRAAVLRERFGDRIGLVHGRMKGPDKDAVMEAFAAGRIAVLVATTVIEVGVDVPNATLIVIEGADRFGLAQLHQLRGRVGRGGGLSRCLLLRGSSLSETARARLALMRDTTDGFLIAEKDLELRGAGEILGTRQSGEAAFRLVPPEMLAEGLATATDDARLLIERDGGLEGPRGAAARICLYLFERDAAVGLLRSG
ncbi:ATP-dependent DNA helicase RecG [Sphingomonas jatrophae]|uniref:ATP-dependent DNA helicase RecG n=1 Tax=Sphingomonas jatrophae TaxID=1166337 RepID=A0A1I6JM99_9SPHN|nr:ATP-dependent DNA helicase RecG [Sphingomonas jatrophae]SFR80069.1 ATP-dependent DNA helicase RecG [Sphingomonas jatrophae]